MMAAAPEGVDALPMKRQGAVVRKKTAISQVLLMEL
jgi:hypothetical protein